METRLRSSQQQHPDPGDYQDQGEKWARGDRIGDRRDRQPMRERHIQENYQESRRRRSVDGWILTLSDWSKCSVSVLSMATCPLVKCSDDNLQMKFSFFLQDVEVSMYG